jgi:hypothetical protein
MDYSFFCDRCGQQLQDRSAVCIKCGRRVSEDALNQQYQQQREQELNQQFRSMSLQERDDYWKGVRKERQAAGLQLIPAPVQEARVQQWIEHMTGVLGSYKGTQKETFFLHLGINISDNKSGKQLYELFFGKTGGRGDIFFFVNKIINTFTDWQRIEYYDIIGTLAIMYGETSGMQAQMFISIGSSDPFKPH